MQVYKIVKKGSIKFLELSGYTSQSNPQKLNKHLTLYAVFDNVF